MTGETMQTPEDIREIVLQRYAAAATQLAVVDLQHAHSSETGCCGGGGCAGTTDAKAGASEASCCGSTLVASTDERG